MDSSLSTISPDHFFLFFFQNFQFSSFYILFVFVNMGPYGSKISKGYSSHNFVINKAVMGE